MLLQQNADVFGAQGIISPDAVTDLVVFVHISVAEVWEQVSLSMSMVAGRQMNWTDRTRLTCSVVKKSISFVAGRL